MTATYSKTLLAKQIAMLKKKKKERKGNKQGHYQHPLSWEEKEESYWMGNQRRLLQRAQLFSELPFKAHH